MIRIAAISFLIMVLVACVGEPASHETEKPANLIPRKEFVSLLTEVSLIEAAHQMRYIQVARYSTLLQNECDSMFQVTNSDREAFEATMKYYSMQPLELKAIYEEVSTEIQKRKSDLVVEPEVIDQAVTDSVAKVSRRVKSGGLVSLKPEQINK